MPACRAKASSTPLTNFALADVPNLSASLTASWIATRGGVSPFISSAARLVGRLGLNDQGIGSVQLHPSEGGLELLIVAEDKLARRLASAVPVFAALDRKRDHCLVQLSGSFDSARGCKI